MKMHVARLFLPLIVGLTLAACGGAKDTTQINVAAIQGVTAPAFGSAPATSIDATSQYTGTVTWSPAVSGTFAAETTYTATITLAPATGFTLQGVAMNFFTVAGATSVTNAASSGVVIATFPATGRSAIDIAWYNSSDDIFWIYTAAELRGLAAIVNNKPEDSDAGVADGSDPNMPADDFLGKTVYLMSDIDLGGVEISPGSIEISPGSGEILGITLPVWEGLDFTPVGSNTTAGSTGSNNGARGRPFKGTFDGGLHKISNVYIAPLGAESHALFGDLGPLGIVRNVILASGYISGGRYTGGIVGRNWGLVENSANYATIAANADRSGGGIAGVNFFNNHPNGRSVVQNCYNAGLVFKGDRADNLPGGIVGDTNEGAVENCYNIGNGVHMTDFTAHMQGIAGGTRNALAAFSVLNSYSLEGEGMPTAITRGVIPAGSAILSEAYMKSAEFVDLLNADGNAFALDIEGVNGGFPILILRD